MFKPTQYQIELAIYWLAKLSIRVNFSRINLRSANLRGADLRSADLQDADLESADLESADLRSANLRGADLRSANLVSADLESANLVSADLESADLQDADLRSANLVRVEGVYRLDMLDPRGFQPIAWTIDGEWVIQSGCRSSDPKWALKHWGKTYDGDVNIGKRYTRAIKDFMKTDEYKEGLK